MLLVLGISKEDLQFFKHLQAFYDGFWRAFFTKFLVDPYYEPLPWFMIHILIVNMTKWLLQIKIYINIMFSSLKNNVSMVHFFQQCSTKIYSQK